MAWGRAKNSKLHRPPRILVPNNENAVFTVAAEKFVGTIQRLSLTGGSAVFAKGPVPNGTYGEMILKTVFGNVTAEIQFLHAGADGVRQAQAFSFLEMDDVSTKRFRAAVEKMEEAGFSDAEEVEPALAEKAMLALGGPLRGLKAIFAAKVRSSKQD
jgi:hypothetical protein